MLGSRRRWRLFIIITSILVFALYSLSRNATSDDPERNSYTPYIPKILESKTYWSRKPERYPLKSLTHLPKAKPVPIPKIQVLIKHEDPITKDQREKRQAAVKASFVHSWEGYKANAWLHDEVIPIEGGWRDTFGGWAATLVDALDTLWIMGMEKDFEEALKAVDKIDFTTTETDKINVFETTIRYLGGLLAAYDISGHKHQVLLKKATELGDLLMASFDTPNRLPITGWDWKVYLETGQQVAGIRQVVSEVGSLSLEFTRLSQLTGNAKYYDAVQRISNVFEATQNHTKLPGMWPVMIDAATPDFTFDNWFTLGGMSDSLYEYLPKQFMMLGGVLEQPRKMYEQFLKVAKREVFFRVMNPNNLDLLVAGDIRVEDNRGIVLDPKGQHLGCFAGGMVAIGAKIFETPEDLEIAAQLTDGCVWTYDSQVTGVGPEIFNLVACPSTGPCTWSEERWHQSIKYLNADGMTSSAFRQAAQEAIRDRRLAPGFTNLDDRRYILRPEAIESVFIMYRVTGDTAWQDKAWRMFERIEHVTKTQIAASAIHDVTAGKPRKLDSMESFWLAETLKYFYLIFSEPNLVSLDDFVLNTEAHPLKRPGVKLH